MSKPEIIICDIDGTIADIQHRLHFIDPSRGKKDWDAFFALAKYDNPIQNTVDLISVLSREWPVFFVSGRPEKYRYETRLWLHNTAQLPNGIDQSHFDSTLLMRPDNDRRPDYIVKEEIYLTKIAPYYKIKCVFDDRDQVVAMWRKHGLTCYQVAEGHF